MADLHDVGRNGEQGDQKPQGLPEVSSDTRRPYLVQDKFLSRTMMPEFDVLV